MKNSRVLCARTEVSLKYNTTEAFDIVYYEYSARKLGKCIDFAM